MSHSFAAILSCVVGIGLAPMPSAAKPPAFKPEPGPAFGPKHRPAAVSQAPSAAELNTDEAFKKRLAALDAAMAMTKDFKANFEQRKYTPLLKKPMVSKGVLTSKGGLVKWETTEPRPVTILIDPLPDKKPSAITQISGPSPNPTPEGPSSEPGQPPATSPKPAGEMRIYYPNDKLCEIYPIGGALIDFASAPLPRLVELRDRFSIELIPSGELVRELGGTPDNPALLGLVLRPVFSDVRKHLESIKLLIDETIPAATKVIVTDAEGERTEITLSLIKINSGLTDAEVQLALPDGVRLSHPLGNMAPRAPTGLAQTALSPTTTNSQPDLKIKDPVPSPR